MRTNTAVIGRSMARVALLLCLVAAPAQAAAAVAIAGLDTVEQSAASRPVTTVLLVRHAERAAAGDPEFDPDNAADPPLSAAGRRRADDLARVLHEAGVTAIFASQFARTQQTVAPLGEHLAVPVTVHDARDSAGLVQRITSTHAGGVVVIAGHSNTVPELVEALGAGPVAAIEEAWEYDNLYVVTIDADGNAAVSTLKYGAPSRPGG